MAVNMSEYVCKREIIDVEITLKGKTKVIVTMPRMIEILPSVGLNRDTVAYPTKACIKGSKMDWMPMLSFDAQEEIYVLAQKAFYKGRK